MTEARWGHPIWLARVAPASRIGKVVVGLSILAFVWILLEIVDDRSGLFSRIFFASLCAYIVPMFRHILDVTLREFDAAAVGLGLSEDEADVCRYRLSHHSTGMLVAMTLGAIAAWLGQSWLIELSAAGASGSGSEPRSWGGTVGPLLVWLLMTQVISTVNRNAIVLGGLASTVRIDLLRRRAIEGLARIAVVSTLSIAGAQLLFVFLIIDPRASLGGVIPGFVATMVPMFALFLIPTLPLHRRLRAGRQNELERIERALESAQADEPESGPPLDAPERLAPLNALLAYRREIEEVSEWPFDVPALIRLALYLGIPPLTWVAAALIENLVDGLL